MTSLIKEFDGVYTTRSKRFQIVNEQEVTLGVNISCWSIYNLKNPRKIENLIRAIPVAEFSSLENARLWLETNDLD